MLSPFCRSRANVYTRTSPRNVREPFCKLGGAVQGQFLCSRICNPLKKYLSVRSHELLPRNLRSPPRLSMSRNFLQDLSRAFSRFSGTQLQEIAVETWSILGDNDYNPRSKRNFCCLLLFFSIRSRIVIVLAQLDRISADGDFLQLSP